MDTGGDSESEKLLSSKRDSIPESSRHQSPRLNHRDALTGSVSASSGSKTTDNLPGSDPNAHVLIASAQTDDGESTVAPSASSICDDSEKILRPRELQKFLAWTLIMCRKIREQPVFSAAAQVYQLDAKSRHGPWMELSHQALAVHFYNDLVRGTYRVLCVDGSKPLINCSLTTSIVLKKISAKFAQWLDPRSKVLYGFGFDTELDMTLFITKFQELQSKIGGGFLLPGQRPVPSVCDSSDITPDISYGPMGQSARGQTESQMMLSQLEHLKGALAESSVAAKHWETELQKLNKQNADLKASLDAMMLIHKGKDGRCPLARADSGATAAVGGYGGEPVLFHGSDYGQTYPHPQPQPIPPFDIAHRQRTLAEEFMGNGGPSAISEQLQNIFEEHRVVQRRLNSYETAHGLENENRQLVQQLQKAIGEKLAEALALHKVLTRLL